MRQPADPDGRQPCSGLHRCIGADAGTLREAWPTRAMARRAVVEYIGWYNGARLPALSATAGPPIGGTGQDRERSLTESWRCTTSRMRSRLRLRSLYRSTYQPTTHRSPQLEQARAAADAMRRLCPGRAGGARGCTVRSRARSTARRGRKSGGCLGASGGPACVHARSLRGDAVDLLRARDTSRLTSRRRRGTGTAARRHAQS